MDNSTYCSSVNQFYLCSSVNHPTANIGKFVDENIKQSAQRRKSYIRDTQGFISKITNLGKIPDGTILATLDVTYTQTPLNMRAFWQ